jgi:putative spermidine/putrescine transport system permease protein
MYLSPATRRTLKMISALIISAMYLPLLIVAILSFNTAKSFSWPPQGITTSWWSSAAGDREIRSALYGSVRLALAASAIALVLGTMASFAVARFRFFGRETVSFLVILPIALPGIVTGIAMNRGFTTLDFDLGFRTLVVAHATFCIVVVYNNVIARLRRMNPNLEEAAADLGANAFTTFRTVTFPMIRTALLAGGLLAFALSFDEIVVTTFTSGAGDATLPQWIFTKLARPFELPLVNVVATAVVLASIIPVYIAQRLTDAGPGMANTR